MAKKNNNAPRLRFTVNHALVTIYTIAMFSVFPLFLTHYYQYARRDKFWFFVVVTLAVGVPVLALAVAQYIQHYQLSKHPSKIKVFYMDPLKLSITDIGMLAFLASNIISTIFATAVADNRGEAFKNLFEGSYGRNMGLLMIITMALCYFIVSRFFFFKKYIIYCMFIGMTVMSFVAILNFYRIDVLGIFAKYQSNQNVLNNFTSTIGNKNYLSAMITVALPFSVGLAVATKDKTLRICAYISTGLQFMGLLVATSDGGFLGCFAAFAVMLVILSRDLQKLSRFFFCLFVMMSSAKLLWLFDLAMKGNNKVYTSFSEIFVYNHFIFMLIPIFFGLAALLDLLIKNSSTNVFVISKILFISSLVIVGLGVLGVVALFLYYSVIDKESSLTGFARFFRFNDRWGTHRGFFWIKSFEIFKEFNFREVLFGTGPDTYYNVFEPYFDELRKYGDSSTNAAHNVYINYLITIGVAGVLSYLFFLGTALVNGIRNSLRNPIALMSIGVIVAYVVQDIVNIANPVNTPWLIMFIALSESVKLRANSEDRLAEEGF